MHHDPSGTQRERRRAVPLPVAGIYKVINGLERAALRPLITQARYKDLLRCFLYLAGESVRP